MGGRGLCCAQACRCRGEVKRAVQSGDVDGLRWSGAQAGGPVRSVMVRNGAFAPGFARGVVVFNTLSINRVKSYTCCPCSDSRRICEACARASALCTHARMHAHVRRNVHAVSDRRRTGDCVVCTVWLPRKPGIPRGRAGFGAHALPRNDCQRQQKVDAGHSAILVISVEQ